MSRPGSDLAWIYHGRAPSYANSGRVPRGIVSALPANDAFGVAPGWTTGGVGNPVGGPAMPGSCPISGTCWSVVLTSWSQGGCSTTTMAPAIAATTRSAPSAMDLLAITVLGFKFSGTFALGVVIVVVVAIGLVWFGMMRRRRR
jgi:hypothetical protein